MIRNTAKYPTCERMTADPQTSQTGETSNMAQKWMKTQNDGSSVALKRMRQEPKKKTMDRPKRYPLSPVTLG